MSFALYHHFCELKILLKSGLEKKYNSENWLLKVLGKTIFFHTFDFEKFMKYSIINIIRSGNES